MLTHTHRLEFTFLYLHDSISILRAACDLETQTLVCRLSVCLLRCVLWPNNGRQTYGVYRSRIGMWGRDFDCYHFRPPRSTLTLQTGGRIVGPQLAPKIPVNGSRQNKTLYGEVLGSCGWAFSWCKSQTANTTLTVRNQGSQSIPFKLQPNGSRWSNTLN